MVALDVPTVTVVVVFNKMIGAKICGEGAVKIRPMVLPGCRTTPTAYIIIVAEPYGTSCDLIGDISSLLYCRICVYRNKDIIFFTCTIIILSSCRSLYY